MLLGVDAGTVPCRLGAVNQPPQHVHKVGEQPVEAPAPLVPK